MKMLFLFLCWKSWIREWDLGLRCKIFFPILTCLQPQVGLCTTATSPLQGAEPACQSSRHLKEANTENKNIFAQESTGKIDAPAVAIAPISPISEIIPQPGKLQKAERGIETHLQSYLFNSIQVHISLLVWPKHACILHCFSVFLYTPITQRSYWNAVLIYGPGVGLEILSSNNFEVTLILLVHI